MHKTSPLTAISKWYETPNGKILWQNEINGLKNILDKIFGYYMVQIGGSMQQNSILPLSPIHNHIIINQDKILNNKTCSILCNPDELPFLQESIDVVIVFHLFEFTDKQKKIIEEIYSALIPGGYLISFGFNPFSIWGIKHWRKQTSKKYPWIGKWLRQSTMKNLLLQAGFYIEEHKTFYFRPPLNDGKKMLLLEVIGNLFFPYCGASYMLVAQKKLYAQVPIKLRFTPNLELVKISPKPISRALE